MKHKAMLLGICAFIALVLMGILLIPDRATYATYNDSVHQFAFQYPRDWSLTHGESGGEFHFSIENSNDPEVLKQVRGIADINDPQPSHSLSVIDGDIYYSSLDKVKKDILECEGDCPVSRPIVTHLSIAGSDALRITNREYTDPEMPQYHISIPTKEEPLGVLVMTLYGDTANLQVLEDIISTFHRER